MNLAELGRNFLRLMPKDDKGRIIFNIHQDHPDTVEVRYIWDKEEGREARWPGFHMRNLGSLSLNRLGDVVKIHPNPDGPYMLCDALLQAYNTNMPAEG